MDSYGWSVVDAWKKLFEGIGYANNFLTDTENIDFEALQVPMSKAQAQAEMRVYRAYCYWYVMDMFGTAPICEKIGEINPSSKSRGVIRLDRKELNESIPSLSESKTETYGRVPYQMGGLRIIGSSLFECGNLYWTSTLGDDCIAACDEVS